MNDSHGVLECPNGMHYGTIEAEEFKMGDDWYRAESFRDRHGNLFYAGYIRLGRYWKPVTDSTNPTNCPKVLDSLGLRLLLKARGRAGELTLNEPLLAQQN